MKITIDYAQGASRKHAIAAAQWLEHWFANIEPRDFDVDPEGNRPCEVELTIVPEGHHGVNTGQPIAFDVQIYDGVEARLVDEFYIEEGGWPPTLWNLTDPDDPAEMVELDFSILDREDP